MRGRRRIVVSFYYDVVELNPKRSIGHMTVAVAGSDFPGNLSYHAIIRIFDVA